MDIEQSDVERGIRMSKYRLNRRTHRPKPLNVSWYRVTGAPPWSHLFSGRLADLSWSLKHTFVFLSLSTAVMIFLVGWMSMDMPLSTKAETSLKHAVQEVPSVSYFSLLEQGMPHVDAASAEEVKGDGQERKESPAGLFSTLTSVNLEDPRSMLGRELPGFVTFDSEILVAGKDADYTDIPIETPPPPEMLVKVTEAEEEQAETQAAKAEEEAKPVLSAQAEKVVFIYHTHNRESFLPELKGVSNPSKAYDPDINITQVGHKLAKELEKRGVGAIVSDEDYWEDLDGKYALSYAASLETVQMTLASNPRVAYVLDLHRDGVVREKPSVIIDGKAYAPVTFVIGKANKNWEKNQALAASLHQMIEEKYPGLSRGVVGKSSEGGSNGEYNQSVSSNSLLVEVGNVESSFEELYRSVTVLAEVIAEHYWQAEAVNAPDGSAE